MPHQESPQFGPIAWCLIAAYSACLGILVARQSVQAEGNPVPEKEDEARPNSSRSADGPAVGEEVPSFYSRVVTGPLMNRSVCYVCRNGRRPVVMVFLRTLDAKIEPLLKDVDRRVDRHRADGLRSFGTYLSKDPSEAVSAVQTFSFDHKIVMPLCVASNRIAEADGQKLHEDADVTLILYENRRVVKRFAFRADQISDAQRNRVADAIDELVRSPGDRGGSSFPGE